MPIVIYLNDLPSNHHEVALNTVTEGLLKEQSFNQVYIYIAGKDFTKSVFPPSFLDLAFSNMALSTLFSIPAPWPNCYFQGSSTNLSTPQGKDWHSAFKAHFTNFMQLRSLELKPHGLFSLVTQVYMPQYDLYHRLEDQFYHGLYTQLEKTLARHDRGSVAKDCIYTWCVMPAEIFSQDLPWFKILGNKEYTVEDPYQSQCNKIAGFIEGYWLETVESAVKDKKISSEFFEKILRKYCEDNLSKYPDIIVGTNLIYQKIN